MNPALVLVLTGACAGFLAGGLFVWWTTGGPLRRAYRAEHAAQERLIAALAGRGRTAPALTLADVALEIGRN